MRSLVSLIRSQGHSKIKSLKKLTFDRYRWVPVLFALIVFGLSLGFQFIRWDDRVNLVENPFYNPVTWHGLVRFWRSPYEGLYIPVTYTFWGILAWISRSVSATGEGIFPAWLFHGTNVALHLVNVALVYHLLSTAIRRRFDSISAEKARLAACMGATLFAIHPLQVESVCWVTGLKDLLCGTLFLGATAAYFGFRQAKTHRARWYATSFFLFLLALLAKPTAMILPIFLMVADYGIFGYSSRQTARSLGGWLLFSAGIAWLTKIEQPASHLLFVPPWWTRPAIAGDALCFYLGKLFVPLGLGPDYGRSPRWILEHGHPWATATVPFLVAGALAFAKPFRPYGWPILLALVPLLPLLGIVPFGYQEFSTVADRYCYLAMIGIAFAFSLFFAGTSIRSRWWLVPLGILALLSMRQTLHWRDSETISRYALTVNPRCYEAHLHLGVDAKDRGDLQSAFEHTRMALELFPESEEAILNMGSADASLGKYDDARAQFEHALAVNPNSREAHMNLGRLSSLQGDPNSAILHFEAAVRLGPVLPWVHEALGILLSKKGRLDEAGQEFQAVVDELPGSADAHTNLGHLLLIRGDWRDAESQLRTALELDPGDSQARQLLDAVQRRPASPQ